MNEKLLTIDGAAQRAGMSRRTITRRIHAGELPTRVDPRDRRRKLVHVSDLRKLVGPDLMRSS